MSRKVVTFLAAAAALVAAAGSVLTPAPTWAAACGGDEGVTVVVDFHELGGGVQQACDGSGAGKSAASLFADNGFPITYVQRQPGFVCRVSGAPADDACVNTPPADAYWALFWSDGTSGTWSYATQGVGSLTVPDGGYVGLSWQGSDTKSPPGVAPRAHATPTPTPTPTPSPTRTRTPRPSATPQEPTPSASPSTALSSSATPTSSAPPTRTPSASRAPRPSATPTSSDPGATTAAASSDAAPPTPPAQSDGDLPAWVVPGVLVLLLGAGGATAYLRGRRRDADS